VYRRALPGAWPMGGLQVLPVTRNLTFPKSKLPFKSLLGSFPGRYTGALIRLHYNNNISGGDTVVRRSDDSGFPSRSEAPLLEVRDLSVYFASAEGESKVTNNISFSVHPGVRMGIVGESGCGKTVIGLSILGLLPRYSSRISGEIVYQSKNLLKLKPKELSAVRGRHIAMIFQEPMSALDPVFSIGEQISETIIVHFGGSRGAARERAIAALSSVGIEPARKRYDDYPHQLSGGMLQRVMIAMALVCEPRLLIADEPTTALDVTVQAQILELLADLCSTSGTALLFITHDLGVVSEICTDMITLYAGEVVERAAVGDAMHRPLHPYTSSLMRSLPGLSAPKSKLPSIPGTVPSPARMPPGCRFSPRCAHVAPNCSLPQILASRGDRGVRCCRSDELTLPGIV
jgi:peptide/nickel transport system ATP-binding protein